MNRKTLAAIFSRLRRRRERALVGPSALSARCDCDSAEAGEIGPFGRRSRLSVKGQQYIGSQISALLTLCSPANISWLVVAILVGITVEGMARRRPCANVCQKVEKRLFPPIADGNSPATIVCEAFKIGIGAAGNHVPPCLVLRGSCVAVSCASLNGPFALETSATRCVPTHKLSTDSESLSSAFANTIPLPLSVSRRWTKGFNAQTSKDIVRLNVLGSANSLSVSHDRASMKGTVVDRAARRANAVCGSLHFI